MRQPAPWVPSQPGWGPPADSNGAPAFGAPAFSTPPLGVPAPTYDRRAFAPPIFPAGPPGLSPRPDDPLVSADFSGWWSRSFRLLKAIWRQAALIQAIWVIPTIIVAGIAGSVVKDSVTDLTNTPQDVQPDWRPFVRSLFYLLPIGLLAGLLALVASLATLHLVVRAALGRPLSVRLALHTAVRRLPMYIGWGFLGGLLTLVGTLCCFLPGYYVTAVLTILPTVVLLERGRALARCFELFHARLGDALARLATMFGLSFAVGLAEQVLFTITGAPFSPFTADGLPSAATFFGLAAVTVVLSGASQVVLAPMQVTAYADMRARHEPFSTAYLIDHPSLR